MSDPNAQVLVLKQTVAALLLRIQYPSLSRLLSSTKTGDGDLLVKDVLLQQAQFTSSLGGVWPSLLGLTNTPTVKMLEELSGALAEILEGLDRLIFSADLGRDLARVKEGPTAYLCKRAHEATWTLNKQVRVMQRAIRKLISKAAQTQPELIHVIRETDAGSEPLFYGDYETACHVLRATRRFLPADKYSSLYLLMPGNRRVFADELPDLVIEAPKSMYDRHFYVLEKAFEDTRAGLRLIAEFVPYDGEQLQYAKQNVQHLQRLARNMLQSFDNRPELEVDPRSQQFEDAVDTVAEEAELLQPTTEKSELVVTESTLSREEIVVDAAAFKEMADILHPAVMLVPSAVETGAQKEEISAPVVPESLAELDLVKEMAVLQAAWGSAATVSNTCMVLIVSEHCMSLPQPQVVPQLADNYGQARQFCAARLHAATQSLAENQGIALIHGGWERLYIVREDGTISMPFAATQRQLLAFVCKKILWRKPAVPVVAEELTANELRAKVKEHQPDSLFFSPNNMAFAGDTMANYCVAPPAQVVTVAGETVDAYELKRIRPVKHGLQRSAWFRTDNFKRVHVRANDKDQPEMDLGFGFRAVPAADVSMNGHIVANTCPHGTYTGLWNVIAPNGKALDAIGSSRPHNYESLEECQEDVDFLLKFGQWSTCP